MAISGRPAVMVGLPLRDTLVVFPKILAPEGAYAALILARRKQANPNPTLLSLAVPG